MPPRFQRVFVCLEPLCKAFKSYCRPIVHVDACHLKGKYPGQLVAAMELDGNNGMFPLAYGVVEIESKETWIWFLNQLEEGIGSIEENNWVFMSDQQKGLIPALKERNAEHRFCLRHVYSNFKLKPEWHNKEMKDILDAAALSMTEKEFKMHIEKFDAKNANAAKNYLMKLGPQHWSRHLWGTRAKSGMILNNPSECFNAYIMGERDKPIIIILEGLRKMCIKLAKDRTNKLAGYKGLVCPQAQVKLEVNKKQARFWKATDCGDQKFEIAKDRIQFAVNLNRGSCACNEWDLTGVPCEHVARAIFAINGTPEDYVSPYLHMTAYNGLWSVKLEPMNGENLWSASSQARPLPPHLKRQSGRPKRVRIRDKDEALNPYRAKKRKITIVCSKCKGSDHNARTCRGEVKNKKDHTHEYYMGFTVPIRQVSKWSIRTEDSTSNNLEMVEPSSENLIANPDVLTQESANLKSIQPSSKVAKQVISIYNQPHKPPIPITRKLPVQAAAKAPIPKLPVKKKKPSNDGKK